MEPAHERARPPRRDPASAGDRHADRTRASDGPPRGSLFSSRLSDIDWLQRQVGNQVTAGLLARGRQPQPNLGGGQQPIVIQRDLMTGAEFQSTFGQDRAMFEADEAFLALTTMLNEFASLTRSVNLILGSAADEQALQTHTQAILEQAADAVRGMRRQADNLLGHMGHSRELPEARAAIARLHQQLADEAMIPIIDAAIDAEKKRNMVKATDVPEAAAKVGRDHTDWASNNGRLRVVKEKLGSGAVNTVSLLQDLYSGDQFVFKPDLKVGMEALTGAGSPVEKGAAPFSNRAVAMYKLDQLLGFGVIPETRFASKDGYFGHIMQMAEGVAQNPEMRITPQESARKNNSTTAKAIKRIDDMYVELLDSGTAVETRKKVVGKLVERMGDQRFILRSAMYDIDYSHSAIQEGLTNLQLIDLIAGQLDRHPGNYFIGADPTTGEVKVSAIDNDAAFGAKDTNLTQRSVTGHLTGLPNLVSVKQWLRIAEVTDEEIRAQITGLLSDEEVEATVKRFQQLSAHLHRLNDAGQLVNSFDDATFKAMVANDANLKAGASTTAASYVGRDVILSQMAARKGDIIQVHTVQPGVPSANPLDFIPPPDFQAPAAPRRTKPLPPLPRK